MTDQKSAADAPSRVIDLDGARAARQEAEPVTLKFGGKDFTLPGELPFMFAELAHQELIEEALIALLGEKQGKEFFDLQPTIDDLSVFTDQIAKVYGVDDPKDTGSQNS